MTTPLEDEVLRRLKYKPFIVDQDGIISRVTGAQEKRGTWWFYLENSEIPIILGHINPQYRIILYSKNLIGCEIELFNDKFIPLERFSKEHFLRQNLNYSEKDLKLNLVKNTFINLNTTDKKQFRQYRFSSMKDSSFGIDCLDKWMIDWKDLSRIGVAVNPNKLFKNIFNGQSSIF